MKKETRTRLAVTNKKLTLVLLVAVLLLAVAGWWLIVRGTGDFAVEVNDSIGVTPEQIQKIETIGQWEFLAVSDEELVDTTRKGFFSNDQLARIYYGTLRIGIDMSKAKDGWIQTRGDSLVAVLPAVGLLDEDFIDEARTKTFYESGKWTAREREAMYQKARQKMKKHSLSAENLRSAEQQADTHFRQLFRSMGFHHVNIRFEQAPQAPQGGRR